MWDEVVGIVGCWSHGVGVDERPLLSGHAFRVTRQLSHAPSFSHLSLPHTRSSIHQSQIPGNNREPSLCAFSCSHRESCLGFPHILCPLQVPKVRRRSGCEAAVRRTGALIAVLSGRNGAKKLGLRLSSPFSNLSGPRRSVKHVDSLLGTLWYAHAFPQE